MSMKFNILKPEKYIHQKTPKTRRKRDQRIFRTPTGKQPGGKISRTGHALDLGTLPLSAGAPALMYLQTLAPGSRRSQWSAIRRVVFILSDGAITDGIYPWNELTPEDVNHVRQVLIETVAPPTGRRYLGVLKAVIEFCYIQRRISDDKRARLIHPRNLRPIRGSSPPGGRALDPSEAARFLESCEGDRMPSARRDAVIFGLMYLAGLRGQEVINLDLDDLDSKTSVLKIHGKGAKNREVIISWDAQRLVWRWVVEVRGTTGGPLILPLQRRGPPTHLRRISYGVIFTSLRRRAERCGLDPFTPHDLRRSFMTDVLRAREPLELVAHLVGHSNVNTTARYRRGMDADAQKISSGRNIPSPQKLDGDNS